MPLVIGGVLEQAAKDGKEGTCKWDVSIVRSMNRLQRLMVLLTYISDMMTDWFEKVK